MSVTNPQSQPEQRERCRFDMFTVLQPALVKNFPNKKPEWTYRGDKYTTEATKALQNLVKMFLNHGNKWQLSELYDNTRPKSDPERIVLRYKNGVIERNRLPDYFAMLENFPLPEFLKTVI